MGSSSKKTFKQKVHTRGARLACSAIWLLQLTTLAIFALYRDWQPDNFKLHVMRLGYDYRLIWANGYGWRFYPMFILACLAIPASLWAFSYRGAWRWLLGLSWGVWLGMMLGIYHDQALAMWWVLAHQCF